MWETAIQIIALIAAPNGSQPLNSDPFLQKPLQLKGEKTELTRLSIKLQQESKRGIAVSPHLEKQRVFAASPATKMFKLMTVVAEAMSSSEYEYKWTMMGNPRSPSYLLSRVPRTASGKAREALQRLDRIFRETPSFRPKTTGSFTADDAVPARLELVRSLPVGIMTQSVKAALSGQRVILPLSLFNRDVLMAATGGVTVTSEGGNSNEARVVFSSQEILRGNGYVALERKTLRDGNYGLRLSIGSGSPPAPNRSVIGPSTDLIGNTEKRALQQARHNSGRVTAASDVARQGSDREIPVGKKRITIIRDLKSSVSEDPLSNVLAQLAQQSGVSVAARWPDAYSLAKIRLERSINDLEVHKVLQIIGKQYKLRARISEAGITFIPIR